MSQLDRIRLSAAALFFSAATLIFLFDLARDGDHHWPISIYPMYSGPWLSDGPAVFIFGLKNGQESLITSHGPLDASRLRIALSNMEAVKQKKALHSMLAQSSYDGIMIRSGQRILAEVWR